VPGLTPRPRVLRRISPTTAVDLLQCGLRAAFRADPTLNRLPRPPSAAAVLGTSAHELAEAVAGGEFDSVPEDQLSHALHDWWEHRIDEAWRRLQRVPWLGPMPPAARWRRYQQVRTRTLAMAHAQAIRRRAAEAQSARTVAVEREFATDSPPLQGRVDRIEASGDQVRIIDVKTAAPGEAIKPEHRVQLLLYAAMLRASGMRPTEAAIQYIDGSRHAFSIAWDEVDELVGTVLRARDAVNSAAQAQGRLGSVAALARPSMDTCRFCRFRICCQPFQDFMATTLNVNSGFLTGEVLGVEQSAAGATIIIELLTIESPTSPRVRRLVGLASAVHARVGDLVSVSDAVLMANGVDVRATWETCLVVWQDATTIRHSYPIAALELGNADVVD
jgi:CRISPR/Cas system-associated exonuclease Cas4 (RecB family)